MWAEVEAGAGSWVDVTVCVGMWAEADVAAELRTLLSSADVFHAYICQPSLFVDLSFFPTRQFCSMTLLSKAVV